MSATEANRLQKRSSVSGMLPNESASRLNSSPSASISIVRATDFDRLMAITRWVMVVEPFAAIAAARPFIFRTPWAKSSQRVRDAVERRREVLDDREDPVVDRVAPAEVLQHLHARELHPVEGQDAALVDVGDPAERLEDPLLLPLLQLEGATRFGMLRSAASAGRSPAARTSPRSDVVVPRRREQLGRVDHREPVDRLHLLEVERLGRLLRAVVGADEMPAPPNFARPGHRLLEGGLRPSSFRRFSMSSPASSCRLDQDVEPLADHLRGGDVDDLRGHLVAAVEIRALAVGEPIDRAPTPCACPWSGRRAR
jgi:hypothetical protein